MAVAVTRTPSELMWGCAAAAAAAAAAAQAPAVLGDVLQRVGRGRTCRYGRDAIGAEPRMEMWPTEACRTRRGGAPAQIDA